VDLPVKPEKCFVCGGKLFNFQEILWEQLVKDWGLSPSEVAYVNLQQGLTCISCHSNLRSITLAKSILIAANSDKTLDNYIRTMTARKLKVLEVNEAGTLHPFLKKFANYTFAEFPHVDLHDLLYESEFFDLILHSDTLEHVEEPLIALSQIFRVLKKGGKTIFTTPIIVERATRSRKGMPNSFHGAPGNTDTGMLVTFEYGSDFWRFLAEAGFTDIRIICEMYPAGIAFIATK
jgi:SAM-dependent methyltransferase